jgi:hypothetical protein
MCAWLTDARFDKLDGLSDCLSDLFNFLRGQLAGGLLPESLPVCVIRINLIYLDG